MVFMITLDTPAAAFIVLKNLDLIRFVELHIDAGVGCGYFFYVKSLFFFCKLGLLKKVKVREKERGKEIGKFYLE